MYDQKYAPGWKAMTSKPDNSNAEKNFGEFRRKVQSAEVLSASMEHLLLSLRFTGRVSVVMKNGRVLKSGYEESYFRQREGGGVDDEAAHET
jgi:sulfur carrier protein ThiS